MCHWYWKYQEVKGVKKFRVFPAINSFKKTFRYNLGSVCFGGFVLAVVKIIRIIFEYVVRQAQQLQGNNKWVKVAIWCIRITMAAVQRMMDYVKITAYIMVVMQGCRFYIGAREGCKLLSINR